MYNWRKMADEQRDDVLRTRKIQKQPWHGPLHVKSQKQIFHVSAACYEHKDIIGKTDERLSMFQFSLGDFIKDETKEIYACIILPNHYHILLKTEDILKLLKQLFRLHQKTGFEWNRDDSQKGRRVWCNVTETAIKSDGHFWATMNYIHNNPVKHGWVKKWTDWPYSTAKEYLEKMGRDRVLTIWKNFDISRMGLSWDM
jgi:putative transposase